MAKYSYYFLILLLSISTRCHNKQNTKFAITEKREVEKIDKSSIFLGLPIDMKFNDQCIYISDFYGDSLLIKYHIDTGLINRFGIKGGGPNDILPPTTIMLKDDEIFTFSKSVFKYGYFKLSDIGRGIIQQYDYRFLFTASSLTSEIIPLTNNKFLSSGYYKEGRYAILDENGAFSYFFGEYPQFSEDEKTSPYDVKAMFHQVMFEPNYNLQKVVAISSYVIDIIDVSNSDFEYRRILLNDYNYDFQRGDIIQTQKSKLTPKGVISVAVSDNYIYTLYNPNIDSIEKQHNEIWIFDWEGKAIKKIIPNININLMTIYSDSLIYAISATEEPAIVSIKI